MEHAHTRWLAWVALSACGGPAGPEFAGAPLPTPAADVLCSTPGFSRDLGQAPYLLLDMDQGRSCEIYLEQDECVLAIFRDCTDLTARPREWQGQAKADRQVALAPLYDEDTGVTPSRTPVCCEGEVMPQTGQAEWMRLDCRLSQCNANRAHTGLFLSRTIDARPALTAARPERIADRGRSDRRVIALWDAIREEGWLGWEDGGLFVRSRGGPAEAVPSVTSAEWATQDQNAIYVASADRLVRIDKAQRLLTAQETLPGPIRGLLRVDEGLLVGVAVDDGQTELLLLTEVTLQPTGVRTQRSGRLTGLATRPASGMAVATFDEAPQLVVVSSTLAEQRQIELGSLRGLEVEGVVPYAPQMLADDAVAFLAPCYPGAPTVHCYFEAGLSSAGDADRVGVADERRLTGIIVDGDNLWLGGDAGAIHRLGQSPLRPSPADVTPLEHGAAALIDTGPALWAVSADGRLTISAKRNL